MPSGASECGFCKACRAGASVGLPRWPAGAVGCVIAGFCNGERSFAGGLLAAVVGVRWWLSEQLRLSNSFACVRVGHVGEAGPRPFEQFFD